MIPKTIPNEIWYIIMQYLDNTIINSLVITLTHIKYIYQPKEFMKGFILLKLNENAYLSPLLNIYNNIEKIETNKKYMDYYSSIFNIKNNLFFNRLDKFMMVAIALHKQIKNKKDKNKFYNLVLYKNTKYVYKSKLGDFTYYNRFLKVLKK